MRCRTLSDAIGHTPLLELRLRRSRGTLLVKLEKLNPGGSMKDRMARSMVDDAERRGVLRRGGTIVESSSGNTGTALAWIAAERGYGFVAVVDHHASPEKIRTIRAYGARVVRVEGSFSEDEVATWQREELARTLAKETPGAVFLDQADNPANADGYSDTMAEEIWADCDGKVDVLVGSVGTGGSLSGTGRTLSKRAPGLLIVGVEPVGSTIFGGPAGPYYQSGTGTPGGVEIGRNVDFTVIHEGRTVSDRTAFTTARHLARQTGLLVGGAAGGVVHTALDVLDEQACVVVAILADGGEKYLETVFDDGWIAARSLHDDNVERGLAERLMRFNEPRE